LLEFGRSLLARLCALILDPLANAFLALSLDRAPELVDCAANVIVTGKQLAQARKIVGRSQFKTVQLANGAATLFLGQLPPFRHALKLLRTFLDALFLLV
jgi:hypothetical protein